MSRKKGELEDLLQTLGDFTSTENWDKFFTIRGIEDSFEWYAEWPQFKHILLSNLPKTCSEILVPGCGSSKISEHVYDEGYHSVTNVDFSKVVISNMLRRNVRSRPKMRWRVMDMTNMQFTEDTFDVVFDKGGLDALMEPELGSKLGSQYLSEVKRVLKSMGKFICLTLGESHVLGLIFSKFRFGWKINLHAILQKLSKPNFQTFMMVAEKDSSTLPHRIMASLNHSSPNCNSKQVSGLYEALENENEIRERYASGSDMLFSLEDLQQGAKGDLRKFNHGRRIQFTMGEHGISCFNYKAILFDTLDQSGPFMYQCGVFLVPKNRTHEWLFSSEEGQWEVVRNSKAARLIMVLLDSSHISFSMDEIQKDLSPLIKLLMPGRDDIQIPFMMATDPIKNRKIVHQITSPLTGPIIVEDVAYENLDDDNISLLASNDLEFRRLVFERTKGVVQSEALLLKKRLLNIVDEIEKKKSSSSKSKKRGNKRGSDSHFAKLTEWSSNVEVDHNYLASSYHTGIISGFTLISTYLDNAVSAGKTVKATVIGLGAGLLPMFIRMSMPFLHVEVVELDPTIFEVAKSCFGFNEDKQLKVHIADGIQFVRDAANTHCREISSDSIEKKPGKWSASCHADKKAGKFDILVIDVDSSDSRSGMTCPAADFVEESFLLSAKDALSKQGIFVLNLVSRSPSIKDMVVSRMKLVFSHLFYLQLEEDVNLVIFGLNIDVCIEGHFEKAGQCLNNVLKLKYPEKIESIISAAKKIGRVK